MTAMRVGLFGGLVGVLLSGVVVTAGQGVGPRTQADAARPPKAAAAARSDVSSVINGVAVDSDRTPLANASVRLRNLLVNEVEQVSTANRLGEFSFSVKPGVPYVIEVANQAGKIIAVGDVIVVSAGEVAGTLVAIPARLTAFAGIAGETASAIISTATGAGVTVVSPSLPPVSPQK